ncbi:MAG: hypothetical protein AAGK78_08630, partial [Planctomycetota bacterium]
MSNPAQTPLQRHRSTTNPARADGLRPGAGQAAKRILAQACDATFRKSVETLEGRRLLSSAYFDNGGITVAGDQWSSNSIQVEAFGNSINVRHNGSSNWFNKSSVDKLNIRGGNQNDHILVYNNVTLPATIQGFDGNDTLDGGNADDRIYGGNGNDQLDGDGGYDLLDGGNGNDSATNGEQLVSIENGGGGGSGGGSGGGGGGGGSAGDGSSGTLTYNGGRIDVRGEAG